MKVELTKDQMTYLNEVVIPANKMMLEIFQEILKPQKKSDNTTKVQIVELVSQLEDAVAESNLTTSTKLVTKLKYSAQQL